tara:strand:+ start:797 stop:2614 length:1818 start_codon:yes stop_codon:yes gene_type:complete
MKLRRWQEKVIDEFPDIIVNYRKFILKAPTGAGKTVLASEIINRFFKNKKVVVLCHRLVLLEQLEKGLSDEHKVKKLGLSETGKPFSNYDVLISTNLRSRDFLIKAIENCDLMIIDEAHRVSPNGQAYKELLDHFDKSSKEKSKLLGLTASPERRTGDQKDQLGLAFDAIIDCADIEELIDEGVLVPADYKSFFIHDLELEKMDISTGDFPIEQLSNAIIKSSMIDYACKIYMEERKKINGKPISAWFCPDILVAEETKRKIDKYNMRVELITAKTPIKERLIILDKHEKGELECLISVGVLSEGWDNPNCNIIVHLRPTLSKVFWGQSVGRGLRSSNNKDKCIVIDVSSNFTTFGPVEKLKWKLWNHRKSYLEFKNRFNWISKQQFTENRDFTFLLCEGINKDDLRCSLVYKKKILSDQPCPLCQSYSSTDLFKDNKIDKPKNDNSLHKVFFERVPKIFSDMNTDIWKNMESSAWRGANIYEKLFLSFCLAFDFVSGESTKSENEFWNLTLQAEKKVREFLFDREIVIPQQEEFIFSHLSDGLSKGRIIRPVQTNYGVSLCGENFEKNPIDVNERKFQKALQVIERIAAMGVTNTEELPYYKIS